MRKLLYAAAGVAVLVGAPAVIVPRALNTPEFQKEVRAELGRRLGRDVGFSGLSLGILPPSVSLENVSVPDSPGFSPRPLAKAKSFRLRVALLPLLRGQVQVESMRVDQPEIEVVRNAEGVWNYTTLGSSGGSRDGSQPLRIASLDLIDGQVAITDLQKRSPRAAYQHIDIALRDYGGSGPFGVKASLQLPGAGRQKVELDGTGVAGGGGFDGKLTLDQASIASMAKFLAVDLKDGLDGAATGQTTFRTRSGALEAKGGLDIAGMRAAGRELGVPVALRYAIRNSDEALALDSFEAKVGSVALNAAGTIPASQPMNLKIDMARASITEIARLASLAGVAFGKGVDAAGQAEIHLTATGKRDKPVLQGTIDLAGLGVTAPGWKDRVQVPAVRIALSPEEIRSNGFTIQSGATRVEAAFTLAGYAGDAARIDATVSARDASLEELLRMGKAFGAPDDVSGTGQVSVDVRARGPLQGSLDLSGSGSIRNAQLQVPALGKPLRIASSELRFGPGTIHISEATGSLGSSNFRGSFALKNPKSPHAELALSIDRVDVADLAGGPASKAGGGGKLPVARVTGNGKIEIGSLVNGPLVLEKVRANCSLDKGVIRLDPLAAELYGGRQTGSIVIDLTGARPRYDVQTKLENVDANRLMTATTALRGILSGVMGAQARITFFTGGDDIAKTLNGTVSFKMSAAKLAGADLLGEFSRLGKFLDPLRSATSGATDIGALEGSMTLADGLGNTQDLRLQLNGGAELTASGNINLRDQSIKMRALTVFAKEVSDRAGGNRIGGLLTAAILDERGRIVMPALISGTVGRPVLVPDAEQIAKMKVRNVSEGLIDTLRKGNTGGLVDILRGKRPNQKE